MSTRYPFYLAKIKTPLLAISFSYIYPILHFEILLRTGDSRNMYVQTMISAALMGLFALWALRKDDINLDAIGFRKTKILQGVLPAFLAWTFCAVILILLATIRTEAIAPLFGKPRLILQQWLFVGIGEELLFRGYLITSLLAAFSNVPGKWRMLLVLVLTNAVFATYHIPAILYRTTEQERVVEIISFIPAAFSVGLILSYFFLRTRNILLAGLIHGSINAPLVGKEDDPIFLLFLAIVFVITVELWMFVQKMKNGDSKEATNYENI